MMHVAPNNSSMTRLPRLLREPMPPVQAADLAELGAYYLDKQDFQAAHDVFHRAMTAFDTPASKLTYAEALSRMNEHEKSLQVFESLREIMPDSAVMWYDMGVVLTALSRIEEALACYARACTLDPNFVMAWDNRGVALSALFRHEEALWAFDRALEIDPDFFNALNNRGTVCMFLARYDEAARNLDRAVALAPERGDLTASLIMCHVHALNWDAYPHDKAVIDQALWQGENRCFPFIMLCLSGDGADNRRCAEIFYEKFYGAPTPLPQVFRQPRGARIRIAYLSADFINHAVMMAMGDVFHRHDRDAFEVFAYDYGRYPRDAVSARLQESFEHYLNVAQWSDADIAQHMQQLGVDVLVDLMGYTRNARVGVIQHRPARVCVNYLGFPGTLGSAAHDVILADKIVIPEPLKKHYSEKVAWMDGCYLPIDTRRHIAPTRTRAQYGLPENAWVWCNFSNTPKITPDIFALWMQILHATPESVLWLLDDNPHASARLRRSAQQAGVSPHRLVFAPRAPQEDYLARYRLVDAFLDTSPYNSLATASDALWMGVPLVTLAQETYVSRGATSLLTHLDLAQWSAATPEAYTALALRLAHEPATHARYCKHLQAASQSSVFDAGQYVRRLENAYRALLDFPD